MKTFIRDIVVFGLLLFFIDKLFLLLLFYAPSLETDNRLEKLIKGEVNKDVIIMGSSRGARDILAYKMEDSLNLSFYNLSYPGSDIEFHEFLLKSLIKFNNKPKKIILVVDDPEEILQSQSLGFRYDRLYPLVKYNYINDELINRDQKIFLSKYFYLSRMNFSNLNFNKRKFTELDTILPCGSMPISFQRTDRPFKTDDLKFQYKLVNEVASKLKSFQNFQNICAQQAIELLIVFPPNLKKRDIIFETRIKQLSNQATRFYTYNYENPVYQNKEFYYDESHLLTKGADVFTEELIEWFRQ